MEIKLAEALLRRKELAHKLDIISGIKETEMFYHVRSKRMPVTEGFDNVDADFPKLSLSQVTAEVDFVAKQLRLIDAHIQQTNWTAVLEIDPMLMEAFPIKD